MGAASLSKCRRIEDVRDAAIPLLGFLLHNSQGTPPAGVGALMAQSGSTAPPPRFRQHSGSATLYDKSREQEGLSVRIEHLHHQQLKHLVTLRRASPGTYTWRELG